MEKVVQLSEKVVLEMISVLQDTTLNNPHRNTLFHQQMTMLEMLRCGLDSTSVSLTLQHVLELYDQPSISYEQFKAVELWLVNPLNHIAPRTARQFLGRLERKIVHAQ